MPPAKASQQDEVDFMNSLLNGLDDTFSANPPMTPRKPTISKNNKQLGDERAIPHPTPAKIKIEETLPNIITTESTNTSQEDIEMAALLEGAQDWNWDDMNDFMTPKKTSPKKPHTNPGLGSPRKPLPQIPQREYKKDICTRCFVESVSEIGGKGPLHKKLIVRVESSEERRSVILQDDWISTDVRIGDTINIIGPFEALPTSSSSLTSTIRITSKSNYLILHPDILITATALSNASLCSRKPLISSLVRSASDVTPALVWGNILHQVMQSCLSEGCWEENWIEGKIEEIVRKSLIYVVRIEMSVEDALREVKARAQGLIAFGRKYLADKPKVRMKA